MGRQGGLARAHSLLRRHAVTLLGVAMIAVGGIWAAVAWASTAVSVDGIDGPVPVELNDENDDLEPDVPEGDPEANGFSLKSVLLAADVSPTQWTAVSVNGIRVTRDEYGEFKNQPPAFYPGPDEVTFVRPRKKGQKRQDATSSNIRLNYRVAMEITSDPELKKAKSGEKVKFSADPPGPNDRYSYKWDANGQTGTERQFEYTLPTSGEVVVHVEALDGDLPVAEATVSTDVKAPEPDDDGSGDDNGDGTGGGSYDPGTSYNPGYSGPGYTPNFNDPGSYNPGDSTPKIPDSNVKPDPNEEPTIDQEVGVTVDGELLSVPITPPSGEAPSPAEAQKAKAQELVDEAKEVSAPGALIAGGIIVGLLGLGAGSEIETKRPRRLLRKPDLSGLRRLSPPWK